MIYKNRSMIIIKGEKFQGYSPSVWIPDAYIYIYIHTHTHTVERLKFWKDKENEITKLIKHSFTVVQHNSRHICYSWSGKISWLCLRNMKLADGGALLTISQPRKISAGFSRGNCVSWYKWTWARRHRWTCAEGHRRTCIEGRHRRTCAEGHRQTCIEGHRRTCAEGHCWTCTGGHRQICAAEHRRTCTNKPALWGTDRSALRGTDRSALGGTDKPVLEGTHGPVLGGTDRFLSPPSWLTNGDLYNIIIVIDETVHQIHQKTNNFMLTLKKWINFRLKTKY